MKVEHGGETSPSASRISGRELALRLRVARRAGLQPPREVQPGKEDRQVAIPVGVSRLGPGVGAPCSAASRPRRGPWLRTGQLRRSPGLKPALTRSAA